MNHLLALAMLLSLAIAGVGCSAVRDPLTCSAKGGPVWRKLSTKHFVLHTDLEAQYARTMAADFIRMYETLAFVMQRPPNTPSIPVEIVVFERPIDFYEVASKNRTSSAYFTPWLKGDVEPHPMVVMHDEVLREDVRDTFQHELAHRFLHERFVRLAPWLDEGLAQYYATMHMEEGRAYIGAPGALDFSDRPFFWTSWNGNSETTQIPIFKAPSVRALIEADRSAFYLNGEQEGVPAEDLERRTIYYGAAWKLVHFFLNGPDDRYRSRFLDLLRQVQSGTGAREAFLEAFERDLPQIEQGFHSYLENARVNRRVVSALPSREVASPEEHILDDAEAHLLWARLLPRTHRKERVEQVRRHLEEALAHNPKSPEVRFHRGIFYAQETQFDKSAAELDIALGARPNDPRYLLARVNLYEEETDQVRRMKRFASSTAGGGNPSRRVLARTARL
jgi:tetratricopeptide (TPR) repeat protein